MSQIILPEQHSADIYNEAAGKILNYSPQLFVRSRRDEPDIEPLGTSVLVQLGDSFFLITAAHCFNAKAELINIVVLDGAGRPIWVKGNAAFISGQQDKLDIAVIKLTEETSVKISERYRFLPMNYVCSPFPDSHTEQYITVGFPVRGTTVDNKSMSMSHKALPYVVWSAPLSTYDKAAINPHTNILVGFNQRRSSYVGEHEMNMAPNPQGLSGCGLWRVETMYIPRIEDVRFYLAAIMIEHDKPNNLMVGTKMNVVVPLLKSLMANAGQQADEDSRRCKSRRR